MSIPQAFENEITKKLEAMQSRATAQNMMEVKIADKNMKLVEKQADMEI